MTINRKKWLERLEPIFMRIEDIQSLLDQRRFNFLLKDYFKKICNCIHNDIKITWIQYESTSIKIIELSKKIPLHLKIINNVELQLLEDITNRLINRINIILSEFENNIRMINSLYFQMYLLKIMDEDYDKEKHLRLLNDFEKYFNGLKLLQLDNIYDNIMDLKNYILN